MEERREERHRLEEVGQLLDREEGSREEEERHDPEPETETTREVSFSRVATQAVMGVAKARPVSVAGITAIIAAPQVAAPTAAMIAA